MRVHQLPCLDGKQRQRGLVAVAQHRGHQPVLARHRNADVDVIVDMDAVGRKGPVDARELAQRERRGFDDQIVDRNLFGFGQQRVELAAQRHRRRHVDLGGDVEVRRLLFAVDHAPGDRLAHPGQRLNAIAFIGRLIRGDRHGRRRRSRLLLRFLGVLLDVGLDVALDDPAARPAPGHLAQVDAQLGGHP